VGKTFIAAGMLLHWMCFRPFARAIATAPSKHQLSDVLWPELAQAHRVMRNTASGEMFAQMFEWSKERFYHKLYPEEWFAVPRTAGKGQKAQALAGRHGKYLLKMVEEASGVDEGVFETFEGLHGTIETKTLLIGNPTSLTGEFFESHHKRRRFYATAKLSCLNSKICSPDYAPRMKAKYGEDSNIYRVRVLGEFPLRDCDAFIPFDWAALAVGRDIPKQDDYDLVFGLDVARYGDDSTVLARRRGDQFFPWDEWRGKSTMEIAGMVARIANKEKPKFIFVDSIGVGAGVADRLRELGFPVVDVNVAEAPSINNGKYERLRDELWGNMRDLLEARNCCLHDSYDSELVGQLTTPTFKVTSSGKIKIESKDELKKRGVASPNIADAHIMCLAMPTMEYRKHLAPEPSEMGLQDNGSSDILDDEAGY
jgi:hypothetical protein